MSWVMASRSRGCSRGRSQQDDSSSCFLHAAHGADMHDGTPTGSREEGRDGHGHQAHASAAATRGRDHVSNEGLGLTELPLVHISNIANGQGRGSTHITRHRRFFPARHFESELADPSRPDNHAAESSPVMRGLRQVKPCRCHIPSHRPGETGGFTPPNQNPLPPRSVEPLPVLESDALQLELYMPCRRGNTGRDGESDGVCCQVGPGSMRGVRVGEARRGHPLINQAQRCHGSPQTCRPPVPPSSRPCI